MSQVAFSQRQQYANAMSPEASKEPDKHALSEGIVLSSRVRLARNLKDTSFPGWLKKKQRVETLQQMMPALGKLPGMEANAQQIYMEKLTPLEKQVLVEQHLISREHAAKNAGSSVVISPEETLSIMVNEEDHLRIQVILPGYHLRKAWDVADRTDSELEKSLSFAFSASLGYLTACPTNVGTGLRASAMVHLPGLVISEQINKVIKSVNQIGLAVRGFYGEGTEALGNLFQISNQMTLGESESEIINRLIKVVNKIIESEANARGKLLQERGRTVADQLGRSYGVLSNAYSISSKEALNLLSLIILGVDLGIMPATLKNKVNDLFIRTQPAHLQRAAGKKLNAEDRDAVRADILREELRAIPAPDIAKLKIL
ncbi:MAG: protein arginine kinase [Verrucomicrobiota bacterium]